MLAGEFKRPTIGASQTVGAPLLLLRDVTGANGVNHDLGFELPGSSYDGISGRASAWIFCLQFFHEKRSARIMDRAIYATASSQTLVGSVHDCVHLLLRDISFDQFKNGTAE